MFRKIQFIGISLVLLTAATAMAQDEAPGQPATAEAQEAPLQPAAEPDAKMLGGMSVLGNQEAPMSLFIVPWKSSELGVETNLSRTLNERDVPVDREVFMRELEFYQVSVSGSGANPPALSQVVTLR